MPAQLRKPGEIAVGGAKRQVGYTKGVPMGGDLRDAPAGKAPTFLVAALKDPIGANFDRYQIIKGWLDAKGAVHEKVYDVVWSGDRKPGADGKLPPVGNTVDVENATFVETLPLRAGLGIGWTTYDAKRFGKWEQFDSKFSLLFGVLFILVISVITDGLQNATTDKYPLHGHPLLIAISHASLLVGLLLFVILLSYYLKSVSADLRHFKDEVQICQDALHPRAEGLEQKGD